MSAPLYRVLRAGPLSLRWEPRLAALCLVLAGVLIVLAVAVMGTGSMSIAPDRVLAGLFGSSGDAVADRVIQRIRLPRVVTALFVGAALGLSGAVFQSLSRNALGSPDIIGFTTGAATGAVAQIVLFNAGPLATALSAIGGGMAAAAVVYLLSLRDGGSGGYRLVLVGIGIGAMLGAVTIILLARGNIDEAMSAQLWLAGSLNTRTWMHALTAALGFAVAAPIVLALAGPLGVLELGEDAARGLGMAVERSRLALVMAAVVLAAAATAAAGPIAFVALAAPHLVRGLARSAGLPLASAALMGAVLMLAADLLTQTLPVRAMMPIGLTTGLLGGLYLLGLLVRAKRI